MKSIAVAGLVVALGVSSQAVADPGGSILTGVKGTVLVNAGAGFQVVRGDTRLAPGHMVRVVSGEAVVQGADCKVALPRQSTFIHPASNLCAAPNPELAAGAGADLPARRAPAPPAQVLAAPTSTYTDITPLVVGGVGLGLGVAALLLIDDDGGRRRDEGRGVSP